MRARIWAQRDGRGPAHLALAPQPQHSYGDPTLTAFTTFCGSTIGVHVDNRTWQDGIPVPLGAERCGSCVKAVDRLSDAVHEPLPTTVTETVVLTVTRPVNHKPLVDQLGVWLNAVHRRQWQVDMRPTSLGAAELVDKAR